MLTHNTYFDGKVQSVGFERNGRKLTAGVIDIGEFHFGTNAAERMTVVSGELFVRLTSDNGPLAAKAAARRREDVANWARALQRVFGIARRPAEHLASFLVAGTAGALAVRNGQDDEDVIETITLSVMAAAEALKAREVAQASK